MLIERAVAEALESVINDDRAEPCVWVGLSAGVDSTVLLHAAAQYCSVSGKILNAIHVHHGLSNNADAWAMQAQVLCEQLSHKFSFTINYTVERVRFDKNGDSLEQAARSARYKVFEQFCGDGDVLLQGHHLDDQIETFFMRAIRGSGLTGLSSIPKQRSLSRDNSCQVVRPLLAIEKSQLLDYAIEHQLNWVEDESNLDSKMDRNWWRNELLPQIWQRYPKHKQSLSRTINNIQHEQGLLQQLLSEKLILKTENQQVDAKIHPALQNIPSFDLSMIQKLDQVTSQGYIRAWLAQYVDILPSAIQMQSIYVDMIQARVDSEPSIAWSNSVLYRYRNYLYLLHSSLVSKGASEIVHADWQGFELDCLWGSIACSEQNAVIGLIPDRYRVRRWKAGDVAKPVGRSTRKMKKWWQDYQVPSWARNDWPIIVNKETDEIAAVPGLFVCQDYSGVPGGSGWLCDYKVKF